jgi:hypothetical protein
LQQICGVIDGTHITLSVKPNKQITSSIAIFYNRKCFHIIVLQVVCDCDMQIKPYLLGDAAYPIWPYLLKGYKPRNSNMVDQIRFDQSMNKGHVLIENAFGTLKNQWKILKKINACVD